MGTLLRVIGYGWALIGAANVILYENWETASDGAIGWLLIFNMVLFIMPGLVVGAIGQGMQARASSSE